MARPFTLGSLYGRCQQLCDVQNDSHIAVSEIKGYISTVYGKLHRILVESGMRYFESEDTITTDGGNDYALPAAHLATVGVDYVVNSSTGERRMLREFMVQERTMHSGMTGASEARAYAIVGSNVILYPTPPSGQTYKHIYVPQPTDYSSAADDTNVDVVTGDGENFILWGVSVFLLTKQERESQASLAEQKFQQAEKDLMEWAALRSLHTPRRRVVDEHPYGREYDPGDPWWNPP